MYYGNMLKMLRINYNLTQQNIADIININRVQYNQYENEYVIIPLKHLNSLANYYKTSIDFIFNFTTKTYNIINKELDTIEAGKRLKNFRKENNITQKKLSEILNTNQSVIANYERGRTIIATPFLYTICKKYNVSADYLLGKTDNPKIL